MTAERLRVGMKVMHPRYGEGVIAYPGIREAPTFWVNYGEAPIIQVLEDQKDLRKYRKAYYRHPNGAGTERRL